MELRVALFQMNTLFCDRDSNLRRAADAIRAAEADIVVLPEMFTTGFKTTTTQFAETMDGPTAGWFRTTAAATGKAIVGSIVVREDDGEGVARFYNRLFFAEPDGALHCYDKRHLFSFGGETEFLSPGRKRIIIEYKGFRILPLICYDLRFPVWSRGRDEFDLMIYVASWETSRIAAWDALLRARAIENQSYVVGVNRVGEDPTGHYDGHSTALDFYGNPLATLPDGEEGIAVAEFDLAPLRRFRDKFRTWQDADVFSITI